MELKPYFDRVLLKRQEAEATSGGGIILTAGTQEKNNFAEVVAVGDGYLNPETGEITPLKTRVGSTVLIGKWAGDEIRINGNEFLMVKESEILASVSP